MLKKFKSLFNKNKSNTSNEAFDRLMKIKRAKNSDPILLNIEDHIKEIMFEKYNDNFQVNNFNTNTQRIPDVEMDAEVEFPCSKSQEKKNTSNTFLNWFKSEKSGDIARNRLDIMIKGNKNDNILNEIKKDVEVIVNNITGNNPQKVYVEKDIDENDNEIIKMIVTLPEK
tara:strand:+ start:64840 stop:65349 length:510 start_codon:yes stop_codon:yes gene_type:complete